MDKKLTILGGVMIAGLMIGLVQYQKEQDRQEVTARVETIEQQRQETISGYEEPEDLIRYMLYQIQNGEQELALRGCAVHSLAEGFNLQAYIEYTENYHPMEMLPPANWDSAAYIAISDMRLAGIYSEWLNICEEQLGTGHTVQLFGMEEDIPENPDGKYYESRQSISDILGARSVKEMVIYVTIDGEPKELHWTLTRHGKYWRVLLFSMLDEFGTEVLDIRPSKQKMDEPQDYACEEILPVNYGVLNENGEDDPETTIRRFFIYLTREDVWSAASYIHFYDRGGELHTTADFLEKQADLAKRIQYFYYQMFFFDQARYEWYFRELDTRAGDVVEDLRSDKVDALNVLQIEVLSDMSEDCKVYRVVYEYEGLRECVLTLQNQNGWKITGIEW